MCYANDRNGTPAVRIYQSSPYKQHFHSLAILVLSMVRPTLGFVRNTSRTLGTGAYSRVLAATRGQARCTSGAWTWFPSLISPTCPSEPSPHNDKLFQTSLCAQYAIGSVPTPWQGLCMKNGKIASRCCRIAAVLSRHCTLVARHGRLGRRRLRRCIDGDSREAFRAVPPGAVLAANLSNPWYQTEACCHRVGPVTRTTRQDPRSSYTRAMVMCPVPVADPQTEFGPFRTTRTPSKPTARLQAGAAVRAAAGAAP